MGLRAALQSPGEGLGAALQSPGEGLGAALQKPRSAQDFAGNQTLYSD